MAHDHIKDFEQKFNTKLTEREQMIFNYAYRLGKQEIADNNLMTTKLLIK